MSKEELEIIIKIFNYKEIKSEHIFYQRYAEAADSRDNERFYEWKLIKLLGYENPENTIFDKEIKLNEYFIKYFGIEYPKKVTCEFKKNIVRQLKLKELGI